MKVREALSGYILVTPDNPVTRRVVDRVSGHPRSGQSLTTVIVAHSMGVPTKK